MNRNRRTGRTSETGRVSDTRRASETDVDQRLHPDGWLDRYGDRLFQFALARVHEVQVAEDLVQETFLAALRSRDRFEGRSGEQTWLTAILKHKVADYLRTRDRERTVAAAGTESSDAWFNSLFNERGRWRVPPRDWGEQPDRELEQAEFFRVLSLCVGKLPQRLSEAFRSRVVDENSSESVCKKLEVSPTNLGVMLHRARSRLWHCLDVNWFGEGR